MICLVLITYVWNCTDNPFFEDTVIPPSIRGRVILNDGTTPDKVYVWFKQLNLCTTTDAEGNYNLTIPETLHQPQGGLHGKFPVYFFMSNYRIDSLMVDFVNGRLLEEDAQPDVCLEKILNIRTHFSSSVVSVSDLDSLVVHFYAQSMLYLISVDACFNVLENPEEEPEFMGGFLKGVDAQQDSVFPFLLEYPLPGQRNVMFRVPMWEDELPSFVFMDTAGTVPPGEYEVIPYLRIRHEDIPMGLWNQFGENATCFHPDFTNIPMKIANNRIRLE
jgi:hypothetical protein